MEELEGRPAKIRKIQSQGVGSSGEENVKYSDADGGVEEGHEVDELPMKDQDGDEQSASGEKDSSGAVKAQPGTLSKSQLKKLRKKEEWEAGREYRKAKRKEKDKLKKAIRAEKEAEEKAAAGQNSAGAPIPEPIPPKQSYKRPIQVPITFVLDCDFDDLMTEKERISLASQLTRCYSDNKNSPYRAHLVISSFGGELRKRFETVLANHHHGWKGVKFMDGDFVQAAKEADIAMHGQEGGRLVGALAPTVEDAASHLPETTEEGITSPLDVKTISSADGDGVVSGLQTAEMIGTLPAEQSTETDENMSEAPIQASGEAENASIATSEPSIVYLTSDSPNTLEVLSPYTTYIIGGLVDKNRHKGICYKRACERGIHTAKLPIGDYMTMQSRTVLATNHVIEIMVRWLEDGDWGKAFLRVIPKRKEAKLRVKNKTDSEKNGNADDAGSANKEAVDVEAPAEGEGDSNDDDMKIGES